MRRSPILLLLTAALGAAGCVGSGGKHADVITPATLGQANAIVIDLPSNVNTVKREVWEQAMVEFGLGNVMVERLADGTSLKILSGALAADAMNQERAALAKQIRDFSDGVRQSPGATRKLPEAVRAQLAAHPLPMEVRYVVAGWISRFSIAGTTQSFAGPVSSQERQCVVRADVAVYDVQSQTLLRNSGVSKYSVKSMGVIVSQTRVITKFDLSAASRASQAAMTQAIGNLLGAAAQ